MSLTDDELRRPLKPRGRLDFLRDARPRPVTLASILIIGLSVAMVSWVLRAADPMAGEPVLRMKMPIMDQAEGAVPAAAAEAAPEPAGAADEAAPEPVEEPVDEPDAGAAEAPPPPEPAMPSGLPPAPLPGFAENGPEGTLPRIAPDGRTPSEVYARAVDETVLQATKPRIALMLGGMGLNEALTRRAIELPPAITLAFAPYGEDLQPLVNEARVAGHEILLQLPMEPLGFPAADPGPRTLRAGPEAAKNPGRMSWLLSRFQGYFGVVNYLGSRLLTDGQALAPIMAEVGSRGLHWLDDGSVSRSRALDVGLEAGLSVRQSAISIDRSSRAAVEARLAELERLAREGGIAVGTGTGLDETLEVVADWAAGLEARGFILVPVSAAYRYESAIGAAAAE